MPEDYKSSDKGHLAAIRDEFTPYCCRNFIGLSCFSVAVLPTGCSIALQCKACDNLQDDNYIDAWCNDRASNDSCNSAFLCCNVGLKAVCTDEVPKTGCERAGALAGSFFGVAGCAAAGASTGGVWKFVMQRG